MEGGNLLNLIYNIIYLYSDDYSESIKLNLNKTMTDVGKSYFVRLSTCFL